jgi:hypothetical protein
LSRARKEFSKGTLRAGLMRAGATMDVKGSLLLDTAKCEAEGPRYGLRPDQRCNAPLSFGWRGDHGNPDANSKDNSLENLVCCCVRCHDWKTRNIDVPMIAETVRQRDKNQGVRKRTSRPMPFGRDSKFKRKVGGVIVPRFA